MKSWGRWGALGALVSGVACTGSHVGESNPGNDAGASGGTSSGGNAGTGGSSSGGSAGVSGSGGSTQHGPGPNGSLPSGYCCQSDEDCRYRTCLDVGGGVKMCSDPCTFEEACNSAPELTCDLVSEQCVPKGAPSCIPADQWALGEVPIGGCCVPTFDGQAGSECQGNLCVAFGDISNPYICTQACDAPKDCPAKYSCNQATRFCWPLAETYDCQ